MSVSKSITDISFIEPKHGDLTTRNTTLEKSKTFPEFKENKIGYYVTKWDVKEKPAVISSRNEDELSRLPSDVKVLYLYKEKSIGTDSEILESGTIALQTKYERKSSISSILKTLTCCMRKTDED